MSTVDLALPPSMQHSLLPLDQYPRSSAECYPASRPAHAYTELTRAASELPSYGKQTRLPTPPRDMYAPESRRGSYQAPSKQPSFTDGQSASGQYAYLPANGPASAVAVGYPNRSYGSAGRSPTPMSQPPFVATSSRMQHQRSRSSNTESLALALQIPQSINNSQGSLPELAAQITCLFWFESSATLQQIEDAKSIPLVVSPLAKDATPHIGFRKWVTTILSTTRVAQHVIMLALLFIYRLKKLNPTVKGKPGSEYRLLTVALMLGNKFLDDNTYTNKTWAEVSGISVTEVHVMEVEFLSNMRYSLFTTEAQWREWHAKLGKFAEYVDRASKPPSDPPRKPPGPSTPTLLVPQSTFPSPPGSNHTSPPYQGGLSPYANGHLSNGLNVYDGQFPELDLRNGRKRSIDEHYAEPPPKRIARHPPSQQQPQQHQPLSGSNPNILNVPPSGTTANLTPGGSSSLSTYPASSAPPRLPLPNPPASASVPPTSQPYSRPATQLPPLPESGKVMSSVFPPPVTWSQPASSPPGAGPSQNRPQLHAQTQFLDRVQRHSPFPPNSAGASPTNLSYPTTPAAVTPQNRSSPSYFLFQRSSPYRPVRQVNTLLQNPPSGACQTLPSIPYDRMHYRPLGRPMNDRRSGTLPYLPFETWSEPSNQQWPNLPQPQTTYHG